MTWKEFDQALWKLIDEETAAGICTGWKSVSKYASKQDLERIARELVGLKLGLVNFSMTGLDREQLRRYIIDSRRNFSSPVKFFDANSKAAMLYANLFGMELEDFRRWIDA